MGTTSVKKTVVVNTEQELFVIPCDDGYSCLGFNVCRERSDRLVGWIVGRVPTAKLPDEQLRGTVAAYERYRSLLSMARSISDQQRIRCNVELTPQLVGLEGKRVEVVNCFGETSKFYVGRSTGWLPVHLEIKKKGSDGGGAVCCTPFQSVKVL